MSSSLDKDQIEDLLELCGTTPTMWRDQDMLVCCPVHGESNPSMGVSVDKQICHCFSCGFAGDFAWLLLKSKPDDFKSYKGAREFLKERYALEYRDLDDKVKNIKRYEDMIYYNSYIAERKQVEIPLYKLAPLKSGKETYKYFYDRGFNKEDVKKFMIGRDLESKTVTIPVFNEDETLAGIIGRYISKHRKKNERYKIYDFERGKTLYPLNHYEAEETMILVEGQFDAIMMHKRGYTNTLAKMGVELTPEQANIVCNKCSRVIDIGDNDTRGQEGISHDKKLLAGRVKFLVVDYPDYGKDVCEWKDSDLDTMIKTAHSPLLRKLKRYE